MNPKKGLVPKIKRNFSPAQRCFDSPNQDSKTSHIVKLLLVAALINMVILISPVKEVEGSVLMRVCDAREIKTVTSRVCMLYKRTYSGVKMDKQGNLRSTRGTKGEYSPAKLASDCCKIGCPPHIFAYNC